MSSGGARGSFLPNSQNRNRSRTNRPRHVMTYPNQNTDDRNETHRSLRPDSHSCAHARTHAHAKSCVSTSIASIVAFNGGGGHGRLVRVKGHARSHPTCTRTPVNARPWNGAVISDPGARRIGAGAATAAACARRRKRRMANDEERRCIVHLERWDEGESREGGPRTRGSRNRFLDHNRFAHAAHDPSREFTLPRVR